MSQPADTVTKVVHVVDASGAGVEGLDLADFEFVALEDGAAYTHNSTIEEIGDGDYKWTFSQPSSRAHKYIRIRPTNAAHRCVMTAARSVCYEGEVENQDLDSIYAATARPVISLTGEGTLGQKVPITLHKDRWRKLEFQIVDENDEPVALDSDYDGWAIGVRSADQSTTEWDGTGAIIVPDDSGLLTVEIPENASFFAALTEGTAQVTLYYEIVANLGGNSAKTVAIVPSSELTLSRSEYAQ
ncbi:MAG TPA: hypothetical protein VD838_03490 [Anaeromyxobacteraceae bacterium]|nr:hypothetical protein [Anaeromyxobacteraceae bacterium]